MKVTYFIDRPVLSAVISILIVIVGFIGLTLLPIDQYPQITPPVVKISASYPGASALTVSQAVATPIEQELNGTPGMLYMESNSSNSGGFSATVTFDISADPDLAAVEIQNRVKLAESRLPTEVIQNGISVEKQAPSQLMTICLTSDDPKFDEIYLSNFATINVVDVLRRIPGVGRVSNIGSRYYAMQIWVQPDKLANFGLTVQDIQNALKDQNRESAAGVFGQQPVSGLDITIPVSTKGRLSTVGQFEEIVLRANADGSLIRLRDVARVSLEAQSYNTESGINGGNAAVLGIYMLPGANAMEVADNVKNAMEDISKNFPEGLTYEVPFDMTTYISESIHEVYKTLFEALVLVIFVVFLSLQSWRATLIPVIAVPISLIGTFGFMLIFGFSLNMLTLLGLILAIGIVVDDAIVVVENVEHIMQQERIGAYEATRKAMNGLAGALIATSLVLAAVFVPVSFLPGITGQLYRQFTITIVVSVLISTIVALTLSPVMCSLILKPADPDRPKNVVFRKINQWLASGNNHYIKGIEHVLAHPKRIILNFCLIIGLIFILHRLVPSSFLPVEDQGYFKVELELPEGATLERTRQVTDRAVRYLMKHPAVEYVQNVTGTSPRVGTSQSRSELTVILKPYKERDHTTIDNIMAEVKAHFTEYPECKVYLSTPPVIPGLGTSGGFEMQLEARGDATFDNLVQATDTLLHYAAQRKELSGVSSSLQAEIPQLYFDVDRDKVRLSGVPMSDVFSTMKAYTGSVYVNDFNMFNRIYRVYIQAEAPYRAHPENINLFFVRGEDGSMIPLTSLGTTSYTTGPGSIKRFNMFNSAVIRGNAADGYSSGQAMDIIEQIAREHLPDNIGVEWSGLSYQEKQAGGQTGLVLALVFLFVFLFLSALYESWTVPVAVLLSLPVAALGAYVGVAVCGLENDIYFQIGLVMLVGLAAKNAILIVEFSKDEVDRGGELVASTLHAARLRFRPILMTSLAFILGMLPMVIAEGPGSASRRAIGTGVFFGMITAVAVGILLVPFFFVMIYKARKKLAHKSVKTGMLLLAAGLGLSSCQLGQHYVRPDLRLPQQTDSLQTDSASIADLSWWELYNDTTLQQLLTQALTYNKDLKQAASRMGEQGALRRIDVANLFPQATAEAGANREATNYGGHNLDPDPEFGLKANISWELDLWGNLRWARDRSMAEFLASVENCRAIRMEIVAQVAQAYFELMALDNELTIVRHTLDARRESVRLAEIRFKGGLTSEIVYQQAQVELARTATMVPDLEQQIALKESEISLLVGDYPHAIRRSILPTEINLPDTLPMGIPSTLLERRPDIRQAEQQLIAAHAAIGQAYTNMFPRLSLTATLGTESDALKDVLKSPYTYVAGGLLSPLFSVGKNRARLKASKAAYEGAVAHYEKVVLQAFREVHDAITSFNKMKDIYESRRQLAEAAHTAVQLAQLQYINGVIGYLDLLDAQRSYFDAQVSLSNAVCDKQVTLIQLYKALGGGWK